MFSQTLCRCKITSLGSGVIAFRTELAVSPRRSWLAPETSISCLPNMGLAPSSTPLPPRKWLLEWNWHFSVQTPASFTLNFHLPLSSDCFSKISLPIFFNLGFSSRVPSLPLSSLFHVSLPHHLLSFLDSLLWAPPSVQFSFSLQLWELLHKLGFVSYFYETVSVNFHKHGTCSFFTSVLTFGATLEQSCQD